MRVGRTPSGSLLQVVEMHERPYTVFRPEGDSDDSWGEPASDEYTSLSSPRDLYLYLPNERPQQTTAGEVTDATLRGLVRTDVDIQADDRVDHGGRRYEVMEMDGRPSDANPDVYELYLSRV